MNCRTIPWCRIALPAVIVSVVLACSSDSSQGWVPYMYGLHLTDDNTRVWQVFVLGESSGLVVVRHAEEPRPERVYMVISPAEDRGSTPLYMEIELGDSLNDIVAVEVARGNSPAGGNPNHRFRVTREHDDGSGNVDIEYTGPDGHVEILEGATKDSTYTDWYAARQSALSLESLGEQLDDTLRWFGSVRHHPLVNAAKKIVDLVEERVRDKVEDTWNRSALHLINDLSHPERRTRQYLVGDASVDFELPEDEFTTDYRPDREQARGLIHEMWKRLEGSAEDLADKILPGEVRAIADRSGEGESVEDPVVDWHHEETAMTVECEWHSSAGDGLSVRVATCVTPSECVEGGGFPTLTEAKGCVDDCEPNTIGFSIEAERTEGYMRSASCDESQCLAQPDLTPAAFREAVEVACDPERSTGEGEDGWVSCDGSAGMCSELDLSLNDPSQVDAFRSECEGQDSTRFVEGPCPSDPFASCTEAQGTSSGMTVHLNMHWYDGFCSNYPTANLRGTCENQITGNYDGPAEACR